MMGAATPFSKVKRLDDPRPTRGFAQYMFAEDAVDDLSRARQGFVIYIPEGDSEDKTRNNEFYDETYKYLTEIIGIKKLK